MVGRPRHGQALRRSALDCRGINVVVCDGEAAFQTVFHFHLHVIPRYPGDGLEEPFKVESHEREKSLRDRDAEAIRAAIASASEDAPSDGEGPGAVDADDRIR